MEGLLLGVSLLFPNISHYLRKQGEVSLYKKNFHGPTNKLLYGTHSEGTGSILWILLVA